ncbi:nuclease-related domain-containing protein [Salibacterium salarium]|uniref:nuclease-related domain-containing protein n=1 Tax=Salibacterium salarium TaxID=284579 RepID=UPI0027D874AB|nr:nuclease-related domain-containing protein [Salibacterium salarium]
MLRRTSPTHPERPKIQEQLAMSYAGYRGEESMNYHLSFLPDDDYYILHDLRLPGE